LLSNASQPKRQQITTASLHVYQNPQLLSYSPLTLIP
jgi:hypothetical protein